MRIPLHMAHEENRTEEDNQVQRLPRGARPLRWNLEFKDPAMEHNWWLVQLRKTQKRKERMASILGILVSASLTLFVNEPFISLLTSSTVMFACVNGFLYYVCTRSQGQLYERFHDGTCIAIRLLRLITNFFVCFKISSSTELIVTGRVYVYVYVLMLLGSYLVTLPFTF